MVKLGYVTLYVAWDQLPDLRDWYVENIGLAVSWQSRDYCMLKGQGGARLALHAGEPLADPGWVQLHFEVSDVDAFYEDLEGQGVPFDSQPHNTLWGYRVAGLHDCAGHTVEIYTSLEDDASA
ncbi:MAG TPA: VOC family protein [Anaerolineae bacterium]|jgi:catechol 2,3-dioxygenase-like lactoylglutathione lyase family enzyme|nr:VOC family protein [Anaerolineae bacterium]